MKTKLNDLFDRMDDEKGNKLDDKIQVGREFDVEFDNIINILKDLKIENRISRREFFKNKFNRPYSSKEITKISSKLDNNYIESMGSRVWSEFLNCLIRNSEDKIHNIFINSNVADLDYLGELFSNKTLYIHGDVGDTVGDSMSKSEIIVFGSAKSDVGTGMKSGKILIKGNCDHYLGYLMEGGEIEVEGNAGDEIGIYMENGSITVRGNAGLDVGKAMNNGTIKIFGEIGSISNRTYGGNIYHYNKQIVKDGDLLDQSYEVK